MASSTLRQVRHDRLLRRLLWKTPSATGRGASAVSDTLGRQRQYSAVADTHGWASVDGTPSSDASHRRRPRQRRRLRPANFARNAVVRWKSQASRGTSNANRVSKLVLVRHGQSTWNATPTFTGWCDAPLTVQGMAQAQATGHLLKSRGITHFDHIFTSQLSRAYITAQLICSAAFASGWEGFHSQNYHTAWQLNERHYGALQGLCKDDPRLVERYGAEQLRSWRRDFYSVPPPLDESHPHYQPPPAPLTESLQDCQRRVVDYFQSTIRPTLVLDSDDDSVANSSKGNTVRHHIYKNMPHRKGEVATVNAYADKTILLVAHSNTLRALISYLDQLPEHKIPGLHIPNSVPCVYSFDAGTGELLRSDGANAIQQKEWMWSHENFERLQAKVTPQEYVHSMLQSVAMYGKDEDAVAAKNERQDVMSDEDGSGVRISKSQLEGWLIDQMGSSDVAMGALAGKLWEELHHVESDLIDIDELEEYLQRSGNKLNLPFLTVAGDDEADYDVQGVAGL